MFWWKSDTGYLEGAVQMLRDTGKKIDERLLPHVFAAGLGARQSDQRLPLAQQRQD